MTYSEKLKHPKWQRRRLEVLDAAGFRCQECKKSDAQLHVHHCYYERGFEPWEYPKEAFLALCERCHWARGLEELRLQKCAAGLRENALNWLINMLEHAMVTCRDQDCSLPSAVLDLLEVDAAIEKGRREAENV